MNTTDTAAPSLARTREQWEKCDPEAMSKMSQAAIFFALQDAKRDVLAMHAALATPPQTDGATVASKDDVMIDRRDLFDFVRGGIKSALQDGAGSVGMVASWFWQEATERTERVLGNLGVFDALAATHAPAMAETQTDARDAARYRVIRLAAYNYGVKNPSPFALDTAIDAAIAAASGGEQG
jgi:hypothetical protein